MNFKEYELSIGNGYMAGDKRIKIQFPVKNSTKLTSLFLDKETSNVFVVASENDARVAMQKFLITNFLKWYKPTSARLKVITASLDYQENFFNETPLTLAPHVTGFTAVMGVSSYSNIIFTLTGLKEEMTILSRLVEGYGSATEWNARTAAKIPHTIVILDKIMEYVNSLSDDEVAAVIELLNEITSMASSVNYHIFMFEPKVDKVIKQSPMFQTFDYRLAMKSSPESSRYLIGTDIACTIPTGSHTFYTITNDGFVYHEVPEISGDMFSEVIRKCSLYC